MQFAFTTVSPLTQLSLKGMHRVLTARPRIPLLRRLVAEIAPVMTKTELKKNHLGSSGLMVTEVCLGTMTWGVQNTEADAHEQLDYAIKERLVNFIDTAEVYPVPSTSPNHKPGATEKYIGTWLQKNPEWRERIIIATKVMGFSRNSKTAANRTVPSADKPWQDSRLDEVNIRAACEGSLRRLRTTYIDLYQLHWPDRYVPLWVLAYTSLRMSGIVYR
eukprot:IDg10562t1